VSARGAHRDGVCDVVVELERRILARVSERDLKGAVALLEALEAEAVKET
jgi:predicted translin family RNA/ssDNA-binding protein